MKTYHFISGLPRSGSTLLSAILKQNPRFTAGISDPLLSFANSIIRDTNNAVGMDASVPIEKRRELIRDLFHSFYKNDNEVCFNTNRGWTGCTSLLKDLFPNFKMIVCVRDVPWILDSFENLNSKNPYTIKPLYHHQELGSVHERCQILMGENPNFAGYVRGPLIGTQQVMFSSEYDHCCFIDYEVLTKNPEGAMRQIYEFLEEPYFQHDFNNVEDSYDEFDAQAKITDLHTVRKQVKYIERRSILPNEIWDSYSKYSFWKNDSTEQFKKLKWINEKYNFNTVNQTTKPIVNTATNTQPKGYPIKYPAPAGFRITK